MENIANSVNAQQDGAVERKSWVITLLLAFFIGIIGAHRFYLGKKKTGILMLVLTILSPLTVFITLAITAIWGLIDFILILIGSMKDADGNELQK